jgi:PIN like domain
MPSAARSRLLPEPWVFFLDRSLGGRLVSEALCAQGETVEAHDAHFPKDASDVEWLGAVGHNGWVVLSKDDRIRLNEVERNALTEAGVAAFFLGRSDLAGPKMASAIVAALPAMKRALRRFHVPFIARISVDGNVSVFESAGKKFKPPKRIRP